ncbi:hypothetical protein GGD68_007096 [Paraburkholderia fungorum]|uniref:hypothetical protein n=1 Tax=Paraburkholderia fungorum TaxID=134537 RepID=UPI00160A3B82|nr:hypothetical protein [Paraburkholderia fungorum]MBB4518290.1 hypothetical protein [Paraburkholderia fungorum]
MAQTATQPSSVTDHREVLQLSLQPTMSATLYELTASAARMCLPAPTPDAAPEGWIDLFDQWQTLAGAALGGLMGVAGAWVVAASQRTREQRIAAGMVIHDLRQLDEARNGSERAFALMPPPPATMPLRRAHFEDVRVISTIEWLAGHRPALLALHTPMIAQLSDIDARLSSHLFQCEKVHREFEAAIATVGKNEDIDAPRIYLDWRRCSVHAGLAAYFLERLVLSPWPRWTQCCRMKFWPGKLDRESQGALCGELPPPRQYEPQPSRPSGDS